MTADRPPHLSLRAVSVEFPIGGGLFTAPDRVLQAVSDVSLDIRRGEAFGIVGESGSGKTTLGRAMLGLVQLAAGEIVCGGKRIGAPGANPQSVEERRRMSLVFQDPFSSLNPRMTVGRLIAEPMVIQGLHGSRAGRAAKVRELLALVGFDPSAAKRYPHEFSGGQRQRIGIARALAGEPDFLIMDEPVSALDVSIQAQILQLLGDLRAKMGFTCVFIAHDIAVVCQFSQRVAVMYLGRIMELTTSTKLAADPLHPYSRILLSAVPEPDPVAERARPPVVIRGELPDPSDPPEGCVFHPRCPFANSRCRAEVPAFSTLPDGRGAACHAVEEGRLPDGVVPKVD